jgi:hypothetical protein
MTPERIFVSKREGGGERGGEREGGRERGHNIGMRKNCIMEILKTCILHLQE